MLKSIQAPLAAYESSRMQQIIKAEVAKPIIEKNALRKENDPLRAKIEKKAVTKSCQAVEWGFLIN